MAVDTLLGTDFQAGRPRVLFECQRQQTMPARNYDVTADGQRFLVIERTGEFKPLEVTQLHFVLNWFDELKHLVPSGR